MSDRLPQLTVAEENLDYTLKVAKTRKLLDELRTRLHTIHEEGGANVAKYCFDAIHEYNEQVRLILNN